MEDFINFELAKRLKEKGFSLEKTEIYGKFDSDGLFHPQLYFNYIETMDCDEIIAPTISQVLKWLREEKRLHIAIDIWGRTWGYDIIELTSGNSLHWTAYREDIKSYEDAALDGIEYILDNLDNLI